MRHSHQSDSEAQSDQLAAEALPVEVPAKPPFQAIPGRGQCSKCLEVKVRNAELLCESCAG